MMKWNNSFISRVAKGNGITYSDSMVREAVIRRWENPVWQHLTFGALARFIRGTNGPAVSFQPVTDKSGVNVVLQGCSLAYSV